MVILFLVKGSFNQLKKKHCFKKYYYRDLPFGVFYDQHFSDSDQVPLQISVRYRNHPKSLGPAIDLKSSD